MWEPGLMLICAEIGLLAEARAIFDRLVEGDCCAIRRDDMYMTCLVFSARPAAPWGMPRRRVALELLSPYSGQTANHPTAVCFGVTDLYLAMLALTANRPERPAGTSTTH